MRIFTLLLAGAAALTASAYTPMGAAPRLKSDGVRHQIVSNHFKAPEAPGEMEPIFEQPEGDVAYLSRDCDAFWIWGWNAYHQMSYGAIVKTVTDGDDIYFYNVLSEFPVQTWIKGTRDGNTIKVECPQLLFIDYDYDTEEEMPIYILPMRMEVDENQQGTYVAADDLTFTYNIDADGNWVSADPSILLGVCVFAATSEGADKEYIWTGYGDRNITISEFNEEPLSLPEGLEVKNWVWSDEGETAAVKVAIDGDDFWIAGLDRTLPKAWAKGKIIDNTVVFPSGQYLGPDFEVLYYSYLCGTEFVDVETPEGDTERQCSLEPECIFDYDKENRVLTTRTDAGYIINGSADKLYPLYSYENVKIEYQERNPDAVPATPYDLEYVSDEDWGDYVWMMVPNTDVDGKLLDVSELGYQVLVDDEPLSFGIYTETEPGTFEYEETTVIPYDYQDYDIYAYDEDHTVYIYDVPEKNVGARSVYVNEEGKTLYSNTALYTVNGIKTISADEIDSELRYDINGRRISSDVKGIIIRKLRLKDGSSRTVKQVVR